MSSPELPLAKSSPRIGYVLKMYPRFSETFVLTEMLALERLGADLSVFSLRMPVDGRFHESLAQLRAPVTYLPHRLKASEAWALLRQRADGLPGLAQHLPLLLAAEADEAVAAVELAWACRQQGIEHLHAHFGSVATTVARLAARLNGIGFSFTAHAKDIFHEEVDVADLRVKLQEADFTVTVSDYNVNYLRARYGSAADRVVRLYNGLDLDRIPFAPEQPAAPYLVAVGRLVEKKGFRHLLEAVAILHKQGNEIPVKVIGAGAEEAALRQQALDLGLQEHVNFLGALPQGRMLAELAGATALVAPCLVGSDGNRDGLPTVLLEGLATGTPCISTPVTGIPEAVIPGETGLLVPEGDAPAIARAVCEIMDDRHQTARLVASGRALVERQFDARRNAAQLLGLIERAVA
ncbi:colanic acid biosynthesis glycosyltransferase WcaL [Kineosporia sp. NBRC 101677]|uniref:glycosyltransferase n=1 Tax=Kineosporia sp. NBRC 101677 TaxID=3032197 RepID=UPI0024A44910|nr:glycosyltransferase [Kineosporia sp. NBRC 101677]GLY16978.1 colanic acid biosynthesis glycosyltransferase WcaL [Kineosporia sp. NBRC 101677]